MKKSAIIFAAAIVVGSAGIAEATPVDLYDNGAASMPPSGQPINDVILAGHAVSDSFTLTADGTAETVEFTISVPDNRQNNNGQNINSINWEIGTSKFASLPGDNGFLTPVTELSSTTYGSGRNEVDVYTDSFTLPDIALNADQIYWLTLSSTSLDQITWDISNGSSDSYSANYALFLGGEKQNASSNSFSILGADPDPVPEPSSGLVMASGLFMALFGMRFLSRRRYTGVKSK